MIMIIAIIITFISGLLAGFGISIAAKYCIDRPVEDHSIYMETITIDENTIY